MTGTGAVTGYDVVVLGGGVAGCVLAARLSEDPGRSVCLVEAGPDYGQRDHWPEKVLDSRSLPRDDVWERHAAVHRVRARILGGSSCVNGCWNTWGALSDHAEWERAGGDRWSAEAMEPFRLAAVEQMGLRPVPENEFSVWSSGALEAARELGYQEVDMGTSGGPGYGTPLINSFDGLRWNAAFGYLDPARARPNLTILDRALVDRMDVGGGRVRAVEIDRDGERITLSADDYVVACGTYGSPAVLMRSGIGPAVHLREHGIRPVVDLPGVGANLSDQPGVFVPLTPTGELDEALADKEAKGDLYVSRMLVRAAGDRCPDGSWDLHLLPVAGPPLFGSLPPGRYEAGISSFLMKPASRGRVALRSADPAEPLDIAPGFFSDPEGHDLAVVRWGLGLVEEMASTAALGKLVQPLGSRPAHLADEEIKARAGTYWHPVGTCAMGPPDDPSAVVDGTGRVHGLCNLRVADASVLPTVPAANTQLPVLAAAELLADAARAETALS
ncbi:GMC family oxidoreductase [Streptomyces coriariae]|uniref:GMC family oxidoreductase n=1 Tax=Streptomyces coriariae TaxID=2864460 RepID=UPI001E5050E8|nr:GMC family oxidoreductase [Streptomyces coriariae]